MAVVSIFVADSDGLSRIGLKAILAEGGFPGPFVEAADFTDLAAILPDRSSDMAIVDIHLPGLGGADGLAKLLHDHPHLKVCVLFDVVTREVVSRYLEIGVMGCVEKSCTATEIVNAITAIADGRPYLSKLGEAASLPEDEAPLIGNLTCQQQKVLSVMATGKSNKEIARELGICEGTVKVHVNAAYRALGVHNRVAAVTVLRERRHLTAMSKSPILPSYRQMAM